MNKDISSYQDFVMLNVRIRVSHEGLGHHSSFSMAETILKSYFTDLGVIVA
jgi:hypothetical protein